MRTSTGEAQQALAQQLANTLAVHLKRVFAKHGINPQGVKLTPTPVGAYGYEHVICVPVPSHGRVSPVTSLMMPGTMDDGMALEEIGDNVLCEIAEKSAQIIKAKTFAPGFAGLYLPQNIEAAALGRDDSIIVRLCRAFYSPTCTYLTRFDFLYRC